jgi:hypothetical protein
MLLVNFFYAMLVSNLLAAMGLGAKVNDNDGYGNDLESPQPTSVLCAPARRTVFGARGCHIYGYPSSGGIFVKEADPSDLLYLQLSRSEMAQPSSDPGDEDKFCNALQRIGAKWWVSKQDWANAQIGVRDQTDEESRVLIFGWPAEGESTGVWVLRYASEGELPHDFGRMRLVLSIEERIAVMKGYGADFVEDATEVPELREGYWQECRRQAADDQANGEL